jgi:hypothetical protein
VSPNSGPNNGGTTVTISGSGFLGATKVAFGSAAIAKLSTFSVTSDTQIIATAPICACQSGRRHVFVITAGGQSAATPASLFTYIAG